MKKIAFQIGFQSDQSLVCIYIYVFDTSYECTYFYNKNIKLDKSLKLFFGQIFIAEIAIWFPTLQIKRMLLNVFYTSVVRFWGHKKFMGG